MMRSEWALRSLALLAFSGMAGCGAGGDLGGDYAPVDPGYASTGGSPGDGGLNIGTGGSSELPPEEVEEESTFRAPVVSGKYLWTANPDSGRVALLNGESLAIEVFSAGLRPTYLASVPRPDKTPSALVNNTGSSNASWFRMSDGAMLETKLRTIPEGNRWVVGESGHFAILYAIPEPGKSLDLTEGLQEIVVLDLGAKSPKATRLTVGYRPRDVLISSDEKRAVVVSEEGISLIDLTETPKASAYIELGSGNGRDVSLTPDGNFALIRRAGSATIEMMALDAPEDSKKLVLSGAITDLDMTKEGLALAILRDEHKVVTFHFPEILSDLSDYDETTIEKEYFGSAALSETGNYAALYTNAVESSRVVVLELLPGANYLTSRALDTTKPVREIRLSPDGTHGVVQAGTTTAPMASFSVISLAEARFPRVVGTAAPVQQVAVANQGALVTAAGSGLSETYLVGLPGGALEKVKLASAPLSAGILTTLEKGYVAQVHPEGRVTFMGLNFSDDGVVSSKTVTGFELSAEVVRR